MEREEGFLGAPGMVDLGEAGEYERSISKEIHGNDLDDLWINSWIKSRNYRPKSSGFLLDGKTGRIECTGLDVWGGTITGAIIQTGTSGERVVISEDNIVIYDSSDNLRIASDNGIWLFWDADGNGTGGLSGSSGRLNLISTDANLLLSASGGAYDILVDGDMIPDDDATYDLGSRPYKWDNIYVNTRVRFDYTTVNHLSVIDDSDNAYARIRFDASAGSIGFGRTIYPIANDSYDLGKTSSGRWNNVYMAGNVYFETTANKGFIWDSSGDNAQFYYNNTSNTFVANKKITGTNLSLSGSIVVTGTVDGVDVSTFATNFNTHIGNANAHHAQSHSHASHTSIGANDHHSSVSSGLAITPSTVNGYSIPNFVSSYNTHVGSANSHHSSTSNSLDITPNKITLADTKYIYWGSHWMKHDGDFTFSDSIQPQSGNIYYNGNATNYWKYVYSYYFKYKVAPSSFDKYDDLQILRDLKTSGNKIDMSNLPKEIYDKDGFTNLGNLEGFGLCASKKIVEYVDDIRNVVKSLTKRINKLEKI